MIEYVVVSTTDPQNENEYFDNKNKAIKYAKDLNLDYIVKVDYAEKTEEIIWHKEDTKS